MDNKGDRFLWQCKINYFKGITPSNPIYFHDSEYIALVNIGIEYFNNEQLEEFSYFFRESQYFIPLWTAHIILEYGNPGKKMEKECIDIIKEYSEHPVNSKISSEEQTWLKLNHIENK